MLTLTAQRSAAQQLKDHTKENHETAEALLLPRISNLKQREDYITLLKMFYGFYHPLEKKIAAFLDGSRVPDQEQRRKSRWIVEDLHALGADTGVMRLAEALPDIRDAAGAMGALYVLEGSTLGGKYIANMLLQQTDLKLQPDQLRFFTGYGPRTGAMWTGFLRMLHEFATDERTIQQMTDSANQTFLRLNEWFSTPQA